MNDIEKKYFAELSKERSKIADALDTPCLRGVKQTIVDKYSDQAHFVYELIQNADDALATKANFDVYKDRLVFSHNGSRRFTVTNPFTEADDYDNHIVGDINAITGIGLSSKPDSNKKGNAIGKFGLGFKSVFQYTNSPEIYDPNVAFKIERQIVPILLTQDYPGRKKDETVFVFPFDRSEVKNPAYDSMERLRTLIFPTLFLNNLQEITFTVNGIYGEFHKKTIESFQFEDKSGVTICERLKCTRCIGDIAENQEMLLFARVDGENHRYAIGYMLDNDGHLMPSNYKAFCFFPTKHETKLKFLIHAPFLLTESRETIKEFEDHNIDMIEKLSDLVYDSVLYMRDMRLDSSTRLVDDNILDILPITDVWEETRFFTPFYDKISDCFQEECILPTLDSYVLSENAYWPSSKQQPIVFSDEKLQSLYDDPSIHWVFRLKWNDYDINSSLSRFIEDCVQDSPTDIAILDRITSDFIEKQPMEWLSNFYKWVSESSERRNKARKLPIFLNNTGKAIAAFDKKDQKILFLPAPGADNYETVCEELLKDSNAKELIEQYKLTEPSKEDLIRCIIDNKLPVLDGLESDKCFKEVLEYYVSIPQDDKKELIKSIQGKVKLRSIAMSSGEFLYRNVNTLYIPSDFIRDFFDESETVFLLDIEHYHKFIDKNVWSDFKEFLSVIGINSKPMFMSKKMTISEWSKFIREAAKVGIHFNSPAEKYYYDQEFKIRYIHGATAFLRRILDEKDPDLKKKYSLMLWDVLAYHVEQFDKHRLDRFDTYDYIAYSGRYSEMNFLSGVHVYSHYGNHREGFDSPQLIDFRRTKWIVVDEWNSEAPNELPINRLPSEYTSNGNCSSLISLLKFKEREESLEEIQLKAEIKRANEEAEAKEKLSDNQRECLELGEEFKRHGLDKDDMVEFINWKKSQQSLGLTSRNLLSIQAVDEDDNDDAHSKYKNIDSPEHNEWNAKPIRDVHVSEHCRTSPQRHGVRGNIEKNVEEYLQAYKNNVSLPPLPDIDDDDQDDDDFTPKTIDFESRIRNKEIRQAREIAQLERGDELQQKAKGAERYTLGWFKHLLDLELLGKEKTNSEQREVVLSFAKMEREFGTERTYVLKRSSRNIPQWIEDVSGIPVDINIKGQNIRPVIEVMSVQSFNLRVKLKADTKLDGIDLSLVQEAKITVTRPVFLLEELKKGLLSLSFDDSKNLHRDLTKDIEFIFGPPGTGKTTFLARDRIIPLMQRIKDCKVLVLAPTNKAADVLTSRIVSIQEKDQDYKKWLIRFGLTMDETIEHQGICIGKDVDLKQYPRHVVITTIARFPYDFCITGNSAPEKLVDQDWDYIIIDEASMIPLVSIIYPLYRKANAKFIIAGDPFQIEPIISCDLWKDENIYTMVGLNDFVNPTTSLHRYQIVKLTTQYRSVPAIGDIFSKYRYGGILNHNRSSCEHRLLGLAGMPKIHPLTILKFPVSPYESIYRLKRLGANGGSSYQIYSALLAFEFINAVANKVSPLMSTFRIGVISPYRAQADIIQRLVESVNMPSNVNVSAGTVHGFQGDECEMIVALFNPPPGISGRNGSFINKKNIINVAVSRARDYLVVMMPDDSTENIGNMLEVRKIEGLMRRDEKHCVVYESSFVESMIFGSKSFIEDNAFSTGHQAVNVYGVPEMRYEIRTEDTAVDVQVQYNVNVKEKNDGVTDVIEAGRDNVLENRQKSAVVKLKFKKQDGTLIDPDEILTIEEQQELRNLNSSLFIGKSSVWITEFLKKKMHGRLISPLDVRRFYHFIKNYYVLKDFPSNEEGPQEIFRPLVLPGNGGEPCPHCGKRVKKLQKHIRKVHLQFYKPPITPSRKNCDSFKNLPSNEKSISQNEVTGSEGQPCPHCGVRVKKLQKHIRKVHPQFYKPPITPSAARILRNRATDPEDVMREIYGDW
jgi:hypothetical protein